MVLDSALLNTQNYKVRIKGKVKQSRECRSDLPTSRCSIYRKREPSGHPRLGSLTLLISDILTSENNFLKKFYHFFSIPTFCRDKCKFVVFPSPVSTSVSLISVFGLFIVCVPEKRTANFRRMLLRVLHVGYQGSSCCS